MKMLDSIFVGVKFDISNIIGLVDKLQKSAQI